MRSVFLIIVVLSLISLSCEDEHNNEIIIKTGRECGWCAGADSLVITKFSSRYIFRNVCDEPPDSDKTDKTDPADWNELLATLNWDDFKEVNVNTCALCADGCDTWIYIENNNETHQIRFTDSSLEIEPIRAFVEKLNALHEEFRTN